MRPIQDFNSKQKDTVKWLERMGRPDRGPLFIHLAGTNGKGSTGRFLAASLEALTGLSVGHFLSPHVHQYNERILLGGEMISDEKLFSIRERMDQLKEDFSLPSLTYFQRSFLEAMEAFKDLKIAVIECGVGGREDVTNILEGQAAVISRIGMDHMNILGETIEEIARHKAGILTKNRPLISSDQEEPVREILTREAKRKNSPAFFLDPAWLSRPVLCPSDSSGSPPKMTFSYTHGWLSGDYESRLLGLNQTQNLGTALLALEALADPQRSLSPKIKALLPLSLGKKERKALIQECLKEVYLPGRLEILRESPIILIDGAHNDPAIRTLIANLHWLGLDGRIYPRPALIFGMHEGKIPPQTQGMLFQEMDQVYWVEVEGKSDRERTEEVEKALFQALKEKPERPVLLCGSLYLLDGARTFLLKQKTFS